MDYLNNLKKSISEFENTSNKIKDLHKYLEDITAANEAIQTSNVLLENFSNAIYRDTVLISKKAEEITDVYNKLDSRITKEIKTATDGLKTKTTELNNVTKRIEDLLKEINNSHNTSFLKIANTIDEYNDSNSKKIEKINSLLKQHKLDISNEIDFLKIESQNQLKNILSVLNLMETRINTIQNEYIKEFNCIKELIEKQNEDIALFKTSISDKTEELIESNKKLKPIIIGSLGVNAAVFVMVLISLII